MLMEHKGSGAWVYQLGGEVPAPRGGPLTSRFSGSIHRDFDGSVVGGDLWWVCEDGDGQSEALSCWNTKEGNEEWGNGLNISAG